MVSAICKELVLRKSEFENEVVGTIYFGGGTPSVLKVSEINHIIQTVYDHYQFSDAPEITLEANPDDLSKEKIKQLATTPINRLSIGVQSFFESDLKLMNRAHNAVEAEQCIQESLKYFNNISIDLIYGIPNMSNERWQENIDKALTFNIPHISSYALTVEPKTALANFIKKGVIDPMDDALAESHYTILVQQLEANGYINYELSNFGKQDYFSKNNTAYWQGKMYLGIGPSAHSYDGIRRGWNINNNSKYIKAIETNVLPMEEEKLSTTDRYNEYVMTGLRTIWGVSLNKINTEFGERYYGYLLTHAQKYLEENLMVLEEDTLFITKKGKFLADGIAGNLFMVNLS